MDSNVKRSHRIYNIMIRQGQEAQETLTFAGTNTRSNTKICYLYARRTFKSSAILLASPKLTKAVPKSQRPPIRAGILSSVTSSVKWVLQLGSCHPYYMARWGRPWRNFLGRGPFRSQPLLKPSGESTPKVTLGSSWISCSLRFRYAAPPNR